VDEHITADLLPTLYRRVLDAAMRLEWAGDRASAVRIRRHATTVYARGWDRSGARALERLEGEALNLMAARPPSRSHLLDRMIGHS